MEGERLRLVFMGSPFFAVPSLRRLVEAGQEVALVISQPDRPAGRRRKMQAPPVATAAGELALAVCQIESFKEGDAVERIAGVAPDVMVVAAFGLYLPGRVLRLPRRGTLNVHPSLLPRHRGASPVQAAILAGDRETGVTIMEMTERLDAGPIVAQRRVAIDSGEDAPSLDRRLAELGADVLVAVLGDWASGRLRPEPQDDAVATYAPRIQREDAGLSWADSAEALWRHVRAYRGWPDAFTTWEGRSIKVLEAEPVEERPGGPHGKVFLLRDASRQSRPAVSAGEGSLVLRTVVLEGKRPVSGEEFVRGYPGFVGARLGN